MQSKTKSIHVGPGDFFVTNQNVIISTLLGSCVSACLYDPATKIVGMNHFLLSNKRYARNIEVCVSEAGRYGIHAMELLINAMMKIGAKKKNLLAKAFGGGSLLGSSQRSDNFFCVGEVNTRFVREFLKNEGIPLISSDLGGEEGRVIHFCADDFSVYVRKIKKTANSGLIRKEKKYWKKRLREQEQQATELDIW